MVQNILIKQYSRYKKKSLEESPYKCLLNANIELNPHQVDAFCNAIESIKTGGIILADEVGLGKTIEAGLVIEYLINTGARKILIVLPATLRKQWEIELKEKFNLNSLILDRLTIEKDEKAIKKSLESKDDCQVILTSYDFSSKLIKKYPKVKWDLLVIDEAHNMRNVFHGAKRAKSLYEISNGIPKILLTATPLQNSLSDLHGVISFIDPRIFGPKKSFSKRYIESQEYSELKNKIQPVLQRTLRKDVCKYMSFSKRRCITVDFTLSSDEKMLYDQVNEFLKREKLYSIPVSNRGLVILVIRKLLASSSFALIETFEVLKSRLEKLYQGTKSANAQEGFDLFWNYVEDEIDESGFEETDDEETVVQKQEIQEEIDAVEIIIATAERINKNAKIEALKKAIEIAFEFQDENGIPRKAVIFTESKRTQKYIAEELRASGYQEEDIVLFNGDFDDAMTKEIFRTWQVKNFGNTNYGRSVEYKHAIVDYFKENAKILIVTDAGSEGLNLQFCNTVINYDLPWNPQKIEQRIGRCHRYGQKYDVVAINLLVTENEADRRVYEILSKKFELFDGVFGASDIALGALESGMSFEKSVLEIYQNCSSIKDFNKAFDALSSQLDGQMNRQVKYLRSLLLTEDESSKETKLDNIKKKIDKYLSDIEYWNKVQTPAPDGKTYYYSVDCKKLIDIAGENGAVFLGAFCNNTEIISPVLAVFNSNGKLITTDEEAIINVLELINDSDINQFVPSKVEHSMFASIYDSLLADQNREYLESVKGKIEYNNEKLKSWLDVQTEQLQMEKAELSKEIEELFKEEMETNSSLKKSDIMKKIAEKKKKYDAFEKELPGKVTSLNDEMNNCIELFNKQFEINPILLVNVVLKF